MARKCAICGKGVQVGMQVSHSHIRTKRTWSPNLQRVRAIVDGTPTRLNVCTRCLRSGKVQRSV
ncbi:50S ribosomal protein L28 [Heliophilum fasciatum]|uniref:Large ribosomal subunit protein bL28 n=1 Tax=Heliophilum fasciatum TaxID=35700 RepID=A0A4R2RM18_9FIRM|nr:50S ribosomal protein L28 [Heliophilum fasciatum]MCW2278402.1 large subunit ribosomal protein L28 [Heliophilum fasciatum]TCP63699.1 large subunit ribosomal protein L28 [Heliophilum fasciatum]